MKRNKKGFCLVFIMLLLMLCVSGCDVKKHKIQATVTTTEDKTGFVPDEDNDDPVDNEMRDNEGNIFKTDIQK